MKNMYYTLTLKKMKIREKDEGWVWILNPDKYHYFIGTKSLCGLNIGNSVDLTEIDNHRSDQECKRCQFYLNKKKD